ncbi:MAG: hypothetical protein P1P88_26405, partial [Bacteroidales bacterium]|nr:hypothetical protein [Bacteroidales bacterium]
MTNSNLVNNENADLLSAFSFSLNTLQNTSEDEILNSIKVKLQKILNKEFPNTPEKQRIDFRERTDGRRLNFAC